MLRRNDRLQNTICKRREELSPLSHGPSASRVAPVWSWTMYSRRSNPLHNPCRHGQLYCPTFRSSTRQLPTYYFLTAFLLLPPACFPLNGTWFSPLGVISDPLPSSLSDPPLLSASLGHSLPSLNRRNVARSSAMNHVLPRAGGMAIPSLSK